MTGRRRFRPGLRVALLAWVLVAGAPAPAAAEWLVSPFVGIGFDGATTFVDLENGVGETKITFGAAGGWLGDGLFGLEANVSYLPGFFDSGSVSADDDLVQSSSVLAITGDVLLLTPRAIVRDSLRPYVVGGVGLLTLRADYVADAFTLDDTYLGLVIGGGAIGRVTERTSLRFEVRRISNLTYDSEHELLLAGRTRVSFWRASIGLAVAY